MVMQVQGATSILTGRTFPVDGVVWVQRPFRLDEIDVYWIPSAHGVVGYNIYRSTNPAAPVTELTKLNTAPVTIPLYRDTTVDPERFPFYYYTVMEIQGTGDEVAIDSPASLQSMYWNSARREDVVSIPRVLNEFIYRKYLLLRNTGEVVDLLIRKVSGQRCPSYNPEYEQSIPCPLCFDTGWIGGYDRVRDVQLRILPSSQQYLQTPYGRAIKTQPTGWLAEWPLLRNGDVVVRADNTRYTVMNLSLLITQGILTEQDFDLAFIDPSNAVYQLEVGDVPVPPVPAPATCPY